MFNKSFIIYRKSIFLDTYDHLILPSNGLKLWPQLDLPPILPPYMRRAPGRPKKKRKKANDEPKKPSTFASTSGKQTLIKRNQVTMRCTRCGFWVITWEHAMVSKLHIGKFQQGETRYIFFHLLCVSDTCFWYMLFVWCHVLQLQTNTTVEQPQRGKEKQAASKKSVPRKKNVPSKEVGGHLVTTLNHHLLQTMSTLSQKL